MNVKRILTILAGCLAAVVLSAQQSSTAGFYELPGSGREVYNFNTGWRFLQGEKVREAGPAREIGMGQAFVAEQPSEADFEAAAVWDLPVPQVADPDDWFLEIDYDGDVARVCADGRLVEDNFWNGRKMLVRVSDLAGKQAQLQILPLRKDAPIYLQAEQRAVLDAAPGDTLLALHGVRLVHRVTK